MEQQGRRAKILAAVVELYHTTGEPVGSRALTEVLSDPISSATVRSEMAHLAELGYLEQPHPSSGRIPSPLGYQYYIDHLLPKRELPPEEQKKLEQALRERAREPERLLEHAGRLLTELTACTAFCVPLAPETSTLRRIETALLGSYMVMIALLTDNGTVKSRVVRTELPLKPDHVQFFSVLTQQQAIGKRLEEFRSPALLQTLALKSGRHALTLAPLFAALAELAVEACGGPQKELLVGKSHLYHQHSPAPEELLAYLQQAALSSLPQTQEPQVLLLGTDEATEVLKGAALVLQPYQIHEAQGGVLGVAGSARMDYATLLPALHWIAHLLGELLSELDL